jgi:hypothetical protein
MLHSLCVSIHLEEQVNNMVLSNCSITKNVGPSWFVVPSMTPCFVVYVERRTLFRFVCGSGNGCLALLKSPCDYCTTA